jgi:hypothetical protein
LSRGLGDVYKRQPKKAIVLTRKRPLLVVPNRSYKA